MEGQAVAVGQLHWVQQQARIQSNSSASSSSDSSNDSGISSGLSGQSVIYVGVEGRGVVGALGFSDTLRPDSQYVVQQLRSRGIRVVVLSGLEILAYIGLQCSKDRKISCSCGWLLLPTVTVTCVRSKMCMHAATLKCPLVGLSLDMFALSSRHHDA